MWEAAAALAWAEVERLGVPDNGSLHADFLAGLNRIEPQGPGERLMANRAALVLSRLPDGPLTAFLTVEDFDTAIRAPGADPAEIAARFHVREDIARAAIQDPPRASYPDSVSVFNDGRVVAAVYSFDPDRLIPDRALDAAAELTGHVNTFVVAPFTDPPEDYAPTLTGPEVWPVLVGVDFGADTHAALRDVLVRVCVRQALSRVLPPDQYVYDSEQQRYNPR
ncbi:hypothetical protein Q6348_08410 [Isoptericola sp. b441]|uniref:Uncharacterized protein n=1 Tax=Actinotalea lenta TaxID=3064654 RepID=A0ABT9D9G1_9CELL|nr:hypothetical protein [Isoptericola sp. b441]MDO8107215.1 hypothetical protein [Isoptericola sp. b441]